MKHKKKITISKPKQIELAKQLQVKRVGLCGNKAILKQFTIEELNNLVLGYSPLDIERVPIWDFIEWLEKQEK